MRGVTIWRKLLDVEQVQVLDVTLQEDAGAPALVISVRPTKGARGRCSQCLRRCPGDDQGGGVRRWRALDHGSTMVFVQAAAPRVTCGQHGVVVAAVPWARPGARATRAFEDQCAWLAARAAKTVVGELMRTSWRHVTAIIERVVADGLAGRDVLAGLKRIGIDEISHRKGHRYLTCVVDQDSGRLVWAAPGRNSETLQQFFDQLGPVRCEALTHVSADGAQWIHDTVTANAPQAVLGLDPFHVVGWATRELDKVRRQAWNMMRSNGSAQASSMKGSRWALLKNPGDLTPEQRGSVASIAKTNRHLYRAYLLKEQLRAVFQVKGQAGRELLAGLIAWARRSQLPGFIALAKTLKRFQQLIWNTLIHSMSNAQSEATNTHLRALTRRAYGFHSPEALIAMAMLTRGGLCPPLPGR